MHRHIVHYLLVFMLAIAPVQSAFAGLMALSHESRCEMTSHDMSMHEGHAGMQHDQDESAASGDCDCCDCSKLCMVVSVHMTAVVSETPVIPYVGSVQTTSFRLDRVDSQHPPAELRPPITLS